MVTKKELKELFKSGQKPNESAFEKLIDESASQSTVINMTKQLGIAVSTASTASLATEQAVIGADDTIYPSLKKRLDTEQNLVTMNLMKKAKQMDEISYLIELERWGIDGNPLNNRNGLQAAIDWAYKNNYNRVIFPFNKDDAHDELKNGIYTLINENTIPSSEDNHMITLRDDTTYDLNGCTLKVKPNNFKGYVVVYMYLLKNTTIMNGKILGDYLEHDYNASNSVTHEWGYGVNFKGCQNCLAIRLEITGLTGDGVYMGGALSDWNPGYSGDLVELGAIDDEGVSSTSGTTFRTSTFIDYDAIVGSQTEFKEKSKEITVYASNKWGYGSLAQFKVREISIFFYDKSYKFIKKSYGLLSMSCEVPDGTKYIKIVFPSVEFASFSEKQDFIILASKRTTHTFVDFCNIHDCRRQGVSISKSVDSGVRKSTISKISGVAPSACIDIEDGSHATEKIVLEGNILTESKIGIVSYDGSGHVIRDNYIANNEINFTNKFANNITFEKNTVINGASYFGVTSTEINLGMPPLISSRGNVFRGGGVSLRAHSRTYDCTFVNVVLDSLEGDTELRDSQVATDDAHFSEYRSLDLKDIKVFNTSFNLSNKKNYENMENVEFYDCVYKGNMMEIRGSVLFKRSTLTSNPSSYLFRQMGDNCKISFEDSIINLSLVMSIVALNVSFKRCELKNLPNSVYGLILFKSDRQDTHLVLDECDFQISHPNPKFVHWNPAVNTFKINISIKNCDIKNTSSNSSLKITSTLTPDSIKYLEVIDSKLTNIKCDYRHNDLEEDVVYE